MTEFVHLHVHSQYSMLDGAVKVKNLVKHVAKLGMNAVALTDHGNMFGAISFYKAAKDAGVKAILGAELEVVMGGHGHHLPLLAATEEGYKNLVWLVSRGYVEPDPAGVPGVPCVPLSALEGRTKGLVALTGCMGGLVARSVLSYITGKANNKNSRKTIDLKKSEEGQDTSAYQIYANLGLEYVPPELREDSGEVEMAEKYNLPKLLTLRDIKGDLHVHSFWSDGLIEMKDIKKICKKFQYEYLAITDHSISNLYGNGLDAARLLEKIDYILELRKGIKDFNLLIGGEVDIKDPSLLDYDESILKKIDIALASMQSNCLNSVEENTSRIAGAIKNSMIDAIAHPTRVVFFP